MKTFTALLLMSQAMTSSASNPYFPGPESFPDSQDGYVCLITDYLMPEEVYGLGFALSKEPGCRGGNLYDVNVACPIDTAGRDNPYACGHRRFTPAQLQMLQELLLSASERNLKVNALRGECQVDGTPKQTCFYAITYSNFKDGPETPEQQGEPRRGKESQAENPK